MKRITSLVLVGLLLMVMSALTVTSVSAASTWCDFMNGMTDNGPGMAMNGIPFKAGEVLTYTIESGGNTATSATLENFATNTVVGASSVPGTLVYAFPADGVYTMLLTFQGGNTMALWSLSCTDVPQSAAIGDGRLNKFDLAAPVAIYSGYKVYAIDPSDGHGVLALSFSAADVPSQKPDAPVLLVESTNPFTGAKISLYVLPSGELQLNTQDADGKDYVFRWSA